MEKNFMVPNISNAKSLVSVADAAERLGVNRNTVRRHFPVVQLGRRVLVRLSDIEAKAGGGGSNATG